MLFEDKTAILRRGLFEVQNEVGLGRAEEHYHQAYREWLQSEGVPHTSKQTHTILYAEQPVHELRPDFVAWDCITLEMKAVPRRLREESWVQLYNYLKLRGDRLGLLVNMGLERVRVQRIVHDPTSSGMTENWEAWSDNASAVSASCEETIRQLVHSLHQGQYCGYGAEIIEEVLLFALERADLSVKSRPRGTSWFRGALLGECSLDCLLIDDAVPLVFTALFDNNQFNRHRTRSFLSSLNLHRGLAINFGKQTLEINAVSREP